MDYSKELSSLSYDEWLEINNEFDSFCQKQPCCDCIFKPDLNKKKKSCFKQFIAMKQNIYNKEQQ